MIEGLTASWISNTDSLKELELRQTAVDDMPEDASENSNPESEGLVLSVILVVGPPDPNALSYLVPRSVFERELPVHVGALSALPDSQNSDTELLDAMLDILEVMNPHDIVVFICDTPQTLDAAVSLMEP